MVPLAAPLAAILLATTPPATTAAEAPSATPAAADPSTSWTVPAAHAGGLLLAMRLTVSLAWPDAYDPTDWRDQREQLKLAFTRPRFVVDPLGETERRLLGTKC